MKCKEREYVMKKCLLCKGNLFEKPLITLENMPISAQNIPTKDELKNDKVLTLNLCQCKECGLVQFDCAPVNYYKDVIRSGGYSTTMAELRRKQYSHLIDTYNLRKRKFIEVGCGQGEFLSVLTEFDVDVFGIENKMDLVILAKNKGLNVENNFLSDKDSKIKQGPFDVFLSFNFLEHQPDPNGMLQGIYNNLTEEGMGLITVPSLEYVLEHNGYYELIRDHLAYYTFETLEFLLNKNGFDVLEKDLINRDTLSVIVRKRKRLDVTSLKNSYEAICGELNQYINKLNQRGKTVAIWGASHQGFTLASTANLGSKIKYIIDSAPFKQGKFAPGSHIPIISPDEAKNNLTDAIIIMAPGYTDEIAGIIKSEFGKHIEIAVMITKQLQMYGEDI